MPGRGGLVWPHYFPGRYRSGSGFLLAQTGVPDLQCSVRTAADEALAVGVNGHAVDRVRVPPERQRFITRVRVPDLHRLVMTAADQALAVRHTGHSRDRG